MHVREHSVSDSTPIRRTNERTNERSITIKKIETNNTSIRDSNSYFARANARIGRMTEHHRPRPLPLFRSLLFISIGIRVVYTTTLFGCWEERQLDLRVRKREKIAKRAWRAQHLDTIDKCELSRERKSGHERASVHAYNGDIIVRIYFVSNYTFARCGNRWYQSKLPTTHRQDSR